MLLKKYKHIIGEKILSIYNTVFFRLKQKLAHFYHFFARLISQKTDINNNFEAIIFKGIQRIYLTKCSKYVLNSIGEACE